MRWLLPLLLSVMLWTAPAQAGELVLNGKGTRQAMFIDLYTCELYVTQPASTWSDLVNSDAPVRIELSVHGNPPDDLPDNWREVLREELSDKVYQKVRDRYDDLVTGDEVVIDYRPGEGAHVSLNGKTLFVDPGRGLVDSMLAQWIGDDPVSESLKAALLGQ